VAYTHHPTQGRREFAGAMSYRPEAAPSAAGFALLSNSSAVNSSAALRRTVFHAPHYQHTRIPLMGGRAGIYISAYAVPTLPGRSRLMVPARRQPAPAVYARAPRGALSAAAARGRCGSSRRVSLRSCGGCRRSRRG
jgi:hypothetical protein